MANIYKNNYFKDIFDLKVPLQISWNTLNNFNLIKYDKSAISRIDLQNELSIFGDINEPIPPKNIISIFKNSHHIKNNFQKINNIISNNIYSISDYHNTLLHETNNINNDKQIFNFYFNIFINNFPPNKKITPKNPCSSDNSQKHILKIIIFNIIRI